MLKISQQDNVKKDFTRRLLSSETFNLMILHFSLQNRSSSIEERNICLLHDSLTVLLFFMYLYSIVTLLLELGNKHKFCSCSATKMRKWAGGKCACLLHTNYSLRICVQKDVQRNGRNSSQFKVVKLHMKHKICICACQLKFIKVFNVKRENKSESYQSLFSISN